MGDRGEGADGHAPLATEVALAQGNLGVLKIALRTLELARSISYL